MNAAVILIPPRLSNRHVLEMPRKNTGSKELAVGYFAAFFIEQLFEFLVIHSCHEELTSFLCELYCLLTPLWCKDRLQHCADERLPVLLIGGGFAD